MVDSSLLLERLSGLGLIDESRSELALARASRHGVSVAEAVVWYDMVDEDAVVDALAELTQIPVLRLNDVECDSQVSSTIPAELAARHRALAVEIRYVSGIKQLVVAMTHPKDLEALAALKDLTRRPLRPVLVGPVQFSNAYERWFGIPDPGRLVIDASELQDVPEIDLLGLEPLDPVDDDFASLGEADGSHAEILSSDAADAFYSRSEASENVLEESLDDDDGIPEHTQRFEPPGNTAVGFAFSADQSKEDQISVGSDEEEPGDPPPLEVPSDELEPVDSEEGEHFEGASGDVSKTGLSGALASTGTDFVMVKEESGGDLPTLATAGNQSDRPPEKGEKTDYREVGRTILKSGKRKHSKETRRGSKAAPKSVPVQAVAPVVEENTTERAAFALDDLPTDVLVKVLLKVLVDTGAVPEAKIREAVQDVLRPTGE